MSYGLRRTVGRIDPFNGTSSPFTSGGAPQTKQMAGNLDQQWNQLISQQPGPYDADMEYRARRRMIEELLGNLRPVGPSAHMLSGVTRF